MSQMGSLTSLTINRLTYGLNWGRDHFTTHAQLKLTYCIYILQSIDYYLSEQSQVNRRLHEEVIKLLQSQSDPNMTLGK